VCSAGYSSLDSITQTQSERSPPLAASSTSSALHQLSCHHSLMVPPTHSCWFCPTRFCPPSFSSVLSVTLPSVLPLSKSVLPVTVLSAFRGSTWFCPTGIRLVGGSALLCHLSWFCPLSWFHPSPPSLRFSPPSFHGISSRGCVGACVSILCL
jgi:hypothetical protein